MVLHALFGLAEIKYLETKIMAARTASNLVMCRQVWVVIMNLNSHSYLSRKCSAVGVDNKKFKKESFFCTHCFFLVD